MKTIWTRIETWLTANAPTILASLNPPATPAQIAEAEAALGVKLPPEVVESYLIHNGQAEESLGLVDGRELLSLERLVDEWSVWKDLLDSGDFADAESETEGETVSDWWHPAWIPLTYDGCGNHDCLDLNPGPKGVLGQIIEMWHDDSERPVVADSFQEWLDSFADGLEAGQYELSEEYGGIVAIDDGEYDDDEEDDDDGEKDEKDDDDDKEPAKV